MRKLLVAVSVLTVGLASLIASAAGATPPERTHLTFDFDQVFIDDFTCPFTFEERLVGHVIITTFFDNEGNVTGTKLNVVGVGEATNPETGRTLQFVQANLYDGLDRSNRTTAGLRFMAYVPGGGVVLLDAGRVVHVDGEVEFEAGPHQLINGDVDEFCGFLAGA
jgi:hypothetical protein